MLLRIFMFSAILILVFLWVGYDTNNKIGVTQLSPNPTESVKE